MMRPSSFSHRSVGPFSGAPPVRRGEERRFCRTAIALLTAIGVSLAGSGCGEKRSADGHHDHDHHGEHGDESGESPARFKAGQGLQLAPETAAALGVATADVEERAITPVFEITAAVFAPGPPAQAAALVPMNVADELERTSLSEVRLVSVNRDLSSALTQAEIVLELPRVSSLGSTIYLQLHGAPRDALAVPRDAMLRTATGSFVYVVNGAFLLRTAVVIGGSDGEYVEIRDGLYAGDVVVTAAVEQLWLTELRLTKGGGHSH